MTEWFIANRDWIFSGIGVFLISAITSILTFYVSTVKYQSWKEKRQDKIAVFRHLMSTRNINDYERVKAINSIDIIFNDCKKVTEACVVYIQAMKDYEKAVEKSYADARENSTKANEVDKSAVMNGEIKLLKEISADLGYTNIDVNAIVHNSFQPGWLNERRDMEYFMLGELNELAGKAPQGLNVGGVNLNNAPALCNKCKNKLNSICDPSKKKMESFMKG
jgi:NACalpha-BTF3-like transcription factor